LQLERDVICSFVMSNFPYDILISYRQQDREATGKLQAACEAPRLDVWARRPDEARPVLAESKKGRWRSAWQKP
jgi:hypothetical protein